MIILDEHKLSRFFDSVSSGFERSPLEIFTVIALLLVFLGFLLMVYKIQKKKAQREKSKTLQEKYERLMKKYDLNPSEQELLQRLAGYLKTLDKKYLLLMNQATFNACANRLREKEEIPAASISALRLKLGFSTRDPEQIPSSSAELPDGMAVLILLEREGGKNRVSGRIFNRESQSIIINLEKDSPFFLSGTPVTVYFQNRSGVFSFSTFVQGCKEKTLHLAHSENITRIQRRKYYRRRVTLPVFVKLAESEKPLLKSVFLDLGGGGASLKNPEKLFKPGDDLELTFHPSGEKWLNIIAEVIRMSRNGHILHVSFGPLREATRDRILGSLFLSRIRRHKGK